MLIAMIEDAEGVEELPAILAGGGIDLVLEGAADLSQSYGVPWQTRHPLVRAALQRVQSTCAAHAVPFCAIPRAPEDQQRGAQPGSEHSCSARSAVSRRGRCARTWLRIAGRYTVNDGQPRHRQLDSSAGVRRVVAGTHSGPPVMGSTMMRTSTSKTARTNASVMMRAGGPAATIAPSRRAMRWSP